MNVDGREFFAGRFGHIPEGGTQRWWLLNIHSAQWRYGTCNVKMEEKRLTKRGTTICEKRLTYVDILITNDWAIS